MSKVSYAMAAAGLAACLTGLQARAQSTVSVYGVVGTQLVYASGATTLKKLDANSIAAQRLGFKGSEDLGGGLKAFFGLEAGLSPDTGAASTPFWGRGSFVGLSGDFGKISFGRQWNLNDDFMCGLYVCGGYAAFYNFAGLGNTSDLVNNAVKYVTPTIAGFTGGVMAAPGEGSSGKYTSALGTYSVGTLSLGASIDSQANLAGRKDELTVLGAKYGFGDAFVRGAYVSAKSDASALGKASAYDLGAGYAFTPAASLSLDYVTLDRKNSPNDAQFLRLVGEYKLSKRTSFNGNLITLKNKGTSTVALAGGTVKPGGKQNVITFGLATSF